MNASGLAEREAFAAAQVEMTRRWYENLERSGLDVAAYVEARRAAYLDRWREAGRYIGRDKSVLDIGGGNLSEGLFGYFRAQGWDYFYADVGEAEVASSRVLGARYGYEADHFSRRLNHELDYAPRAFDAVFSSHCLEHSMDLELTLRQINRLLKPGGVLVASVPFGWDAQPNHPYFLDAEDWLILIEDAGFRIRAHQISGEYVEHGEDLMIAAVKTGEPAAAFRLDIDRYAKTPFRDFRDPAVRLLGRVIEKEDHAILDGEDWRIEILAPQGAQEMLPVFARHNWSGIVRARCGRDERQVDLFRTQPATEVVRLALSAPAEAGQVLDVTPLGRRDASFGAQAVFLGFMTR